MKLSNPNRVDSFKNSSENTHGIHSGSTSSAVPVPYSDYYSSAASCASPDLSSPVYGAYSTTGLFNSKFVDRAKTKAKTTAGKQELRVHWELLLLVSATSSTSDFTLGFLLVASLDFSLLQRISSSHIISGVGTASRLYIFLFYLNTLLFTALTQK